MQPRVLLDASCLSDGRAGAGIGRYARELSAALAQRDDVDVTTVIPHGPPRSESRPGRFLHTHPSLLRAARRQRPHLVHGLGGEPLLIYPAARQVVTVHDVEMWRDPQTQGARGTALRAYALAVRRLYRHCAAVIAVSEVSAEEAIDTLGLDPARVRVVPHGVSPAFTGRRQAGDTALRKALRLESPYVLWSGSLRRADPRKGLDTLLAAMSGLRELAGLAVAGAPGEAGEQLATDAERLGVRLQLLGSLDDLRLAAVYRGAAAVAVPSRHEGFGLPMLEAMACGTPVVATRGGNLGALGEGAALLVTVGDAAALGQALGSLIRDPQLRRETVRAGSRRAAAFSWDRAAAQTAALYRELARTA